MLKNYKELMVWQKSHLSNDPALSNILKSIMLTGATGFIGSHIAEKLVREKVPIHLFVRRRNRLIDLLEKKGAKIFVSPLDDLETLKKSIKDINVIIHCAGATKAIRKADYFKTNVVFTSNLLSLLTRHQKFVFISSQAAAGPSSSPIPIDEESEPNPLSFYGKSKLLAENHIREWGKENGNNYVILRPSTVYGPREGDLYKTFMLINKGFFLMLGDGQIKISIIHVEDLVNAIITATEHPSSGETYFVSNDEGYSWKEIGQSVGKALNKTHVLKVKIPVSIAYPVAFFYDCLSLITRKPVLINRQKILEMRQSAWLCSNRKIKKDLGWKPKVSLDMGIKQTADWYIKEGWI